MFIHSLDTACPILGQVGSQAVTPSAYSKPDGQLGGAEIRFHKIHVIEKCTPRICCLSHYRNDKSTSDYHARKSYIHVKE